MLAGQAIGEGGAAELRRAEVDFRGENFLYRIEQKAVLPPFVHGQRAQPPHQLSHLALTAEILDTIAFELLR